MEPAQEDCGVLRQRTSRFEVAAAADELVAATRQAIAEATAFDERDVKRDCGYDDEAYRKVKRNLGRLIASGQWRFVMELALDLMRRGSRQVEASDEGMMAEDVEECLGVVLEALPKCDWPAADVIAWCSAMLDNDRVGFIAREPLASLRKQFQAIAARKSRTHPTRRASSRRPPTSRRAPRRKAYFLHACRKDTTGTG
jgi:hypothetical protein